MDWMPQAIREGIFTILFISGPLVVLAAGLGLTIGIVQAATQVQEQTLGSAVKIIGLFIALILFGFYMFQYMSKYAAQNIERAFKLIPTLGDKALPRRNFLEIPKDQESQTVTAAELQEFAPGTKKAHKEIPTLNKPDVTSVNENIKPEKLARPASEIRPNVDIDAIKKQKLTIVKEEGNKATGVAQQNKAIEKPQVPKVIASEAKQSSIANPAPQEKPKVTSTGSPRPSSASPRDDETSKPPPKRIPHSSISDRLGKLQEAGF